MKIQIPPERYWKLVALGLRAAKIRADAERAVREADGKRDHEIVALCQDFGLDPGRPLDLEDSDYSITQPDQDRVEVPDGE